MPQPERCRREIPGQSTWTGANSAHMLLAVPSGTENSCADTSGHCEESPVVSPVLRTEIVLSMKPVIQARVPSGVTATCCGCCPREIELPGIICKVLESIRYAALPNWLTTKMRVSSGVRASPAFAASELVLSNVGTEPLVSSR